VLRTLRRVAPRVTGQLVDALLDPTLDAGVRRRLPRVLKAAPSARAAHGLLAAVSDERLDVRVAAVQGLARMCEQAPALAPAREVVFALAGRELGADGESGAGGAAPLAADRRLDHVFTLLALALDRDALTAALHALRLGDARLRGTALEWLDNVLPEELRTALWPHLKVAPAPRAPRPENEVREELLQSSQMLRVTPRAPTP
jgi:ATP:ADP antiporter, AAA family